jgi:hypothetical protein
MQPKKMLAKGCAFPTTFNSGITLTTNIQKLMKSKIFTIVAIAVVALTSVPMEASAQNRNPVPTMEQRQQFARLNAILRRLKPGNARALVLARRMMNLVPTASPQVVSIATRLLVRTVDAARLADISIQVISTFRFTDVEKSDLIVRSVITVSNVAQTIPRIVATSPGDSASSVDAVIRASAVEQILVNPLLDSVVENDLIPQLQPTPTPTPTPVPYGA